jgi:hypothetical protein
MGASAYAYYDTSQVGRTAIDFFTGVIDVEVEEEATTDGAQDTTLRNSR